MTELRLTDRIKAIKPSPTTAAAARARALKAEGRPIISLTTGEPDFDTPSAICAAANRAIASGETRYTNTSGTPALKKAVRTKFQRDNGLVYSDEEVIVGTGAKQVIANALMALVQEGDDVLIPVPAWVSYVDMVKLTGARPVILPCRQASGFKLTAATMANALTGNTRAVMLNSPSNPTGAIYSKQELEALGEVLKRHPEITIICDDIYEHLRYTGQPFFTLAQVCPDLKERVLTVNGVAKAYAMTGWRLGIAGGPKSLIAAMSKYQSQASGAPCSIAQAAAVEALAGDQAPVEQMRLAFERRRDLLVPRVNAIPGLQVDAPDGAFYLFISLKGLIGKTTEHGRRLEAEADILDVFLDDANVAAVGGAAFGLSPYLRVSFAASEEMLTEAFDRIAKLVASFQ